MPQSPFWGKPRYEHESVHLYYLDRQDLGIIEAPGSVYIIGTRGTGKTTLLKALDWDQRIRNPSLQAALEGGPFELGIIGLYAKLPLLRLRLFDRWCAGAVSDSDETCVDLFSAYLDLVFLELATGAVDALRRRNVLGFSADEEADTCRQIASQLRRPPLSEEPETRLLGVKELAVSLRRTLEEAAVDKASLSDTLRDIVPTTVSVGELGRSWASALAALASINSVQTPRELGWNFRFCMDEAEQLSQWQQVALNVMVRNAQFPLFYLAAYTDPPPNLTETNYPSLEVGKADAEMLVLDWIDDGRQGQTDREARFTRVALGAASLRLQHAAARGNIELDIPADAITDVLGSASVDDLLQLHIRESDSAASRALLADAERFADEHQAGSFEGAIYKAYLVKRLRLSVPNSNSSDFRRFDDAELRKRQFAAYLVICNENKWEPKYAGVTTLLHLSDLCLRDVMWMLHELWIRLDASSPLDFLAMRAPLNVQADAVRAAAEKKAAFAAKHIDHSPESTANLVRGLGYLTAELQAYSNDIRALRSPERGLFTIDGPSKSADVDAELFLMLSSAAKNGYLRLREMAANRWQFRLHRSLAPAYKFTHRRPQYEFRISLEDLWAMSRSSGDSELRAIARRVAGRDDAQASLFAEYEEPPEVSGRG